MFAAVDNQSFVSEITPLFCPIKFIYKTQNNITKVSKIKGKFIFYAKLKPTKLFFKIHREKAVLKF